jgi:hypothetical protein
MSPESSKKTSCSFNTFFQSLPSAWSLPGTLEEGKYHNSAETRQKIKKKNPQNLRSISILFTTGKLFEKLILRTIQKGKKLTEC